MDKPDPTGGGDYTLGGLPASRRVGDGHAGSSTCPICRRGREHAARAVRPGLRPPRPRDERERHASCASPARCRTTPRIVDRGDLRTARSSRATAASSNRTYSKPYWATEGPGNTCWMSMSGSDLVTVISTSRTERVDRRGRGRRPPAAGPRGPHPRVDRRDASEPPTDRLRAAGRAAARVGVAGAVLDVLRRLDLGLGLPATAAQLHEAAARAAGGLLASSTGSTEAPGCRAASSTAMSIGQQGLAAVVLRALVLARAPGRGRPARSAGRPRTSGRSRRPRGGSGRGRRAGRRAAGTPSSGPRRARRRARRAPATAVAWAAASRRDQARATCLSGGASGSIVPRSGQVAITTSTPAPRSRRIWAVTSSRTEVRTVTAWVTSLAPMKITATWGSSGQHPVDLAGAGPWTGRRPWPPRSGRPGGRRPRPRPEARYRAGRLLHRRRRRSRPRTSRRSARS